MRWRKYLAAGGTLFAIVATLRAFSVESAGVAAPLLLLNVVVVARFWGTGAALFVAAASAACYSYYFLPPAGFGIEDPEDWVAFITFLVTAVVAGELASRAERRALEAQAGRVEIERLYQELQAAFDRASEAEAARRSEQVKSALLDALTHNLRTPLTAIKAAVTALLGVGSWTDGSSLTLEGRRELLHVIDEESDRLNRFIEALSSAGQPDASQPSHTKAIPLDGVVAEGLHRAETITRDHRIVVALDPDLPPVPVDRASMTEVIYILLDNASKYAPPGSAITVRGRRIDDEHVQLSVIDEGPGIPPELRERVFEKFFRIPGREPRDQRRGGVGLGLPIARRLVEAQGGTLSIDSSESAAPRGTTMSMLLPLVTEAAETERQTTAVLATK